MQVLKTYYLLETYKLILLANLYILENRFYRPSTILKTQHNLSVQQPPSSDLQSAEEIGLISYLFIWIFTPLSYLGHQMIDGFQLSNKIHSFQGAQLYTQELLSAVQMFL